MAVVVYARHLRILHVCMQGELVKNLFVHYTLRAASSAAKCLAIPRPTSHCAQRHPNYSAVRHFTRLLEREKIKFLKIGTLLWRQPHAKILTRAKIKWDGKVIERFATSLQYVEEG
jgi:hypothetical protein